MKILEINAELLGYQKGHISQTKKTMQTWLTRQLHRHWYKLHITFFLHPAQVHYFPALICSTPFSVHKIYHQGEYLFMFSSHFMQIQLLRGSFFFFKRSVFVIVPCSWSTTCCPHSIHGMLKRFYLISPTLSCWNHVIVLCIVKEEAGSVGGGADWGFVYTDS